MRQSSIYKKPPQHIVPDAHLSMEEESLQDIEAHENNVAVQDTCAQIDRLVDVSDAVEDTVTIVDKTPEIGTTEASLLDSVANMVVAGTDANPEDIIPLVAMEDAMVPYNGDKSFGHKVGEEGKADAKDETASSLKDKLAKIWEAILGFLEKCWEQIKQGATYFYASAEKLKRAVTAAMEKAKASSGGEQKATTVTVTDMFGATYVDGHSFLTQSWIDRMFKKGPTPEEHLKRFEKAVHILAAQVPAQQKKIGEEIKHLLEGFDPKDAVASVSEGVFRLNKQMEVYARTVVGMGEGTNAPQGAEIVGKGLMGNFALSAKNVPEDTNDLWKALENLQKLRFGVDVEAAPADPMAYNFPVYAPMVSLNELKKYDTIADLLLDFKNKHRVEATSSVADAIKVVSKKIANRNDEVSAEASSIGGALLKLNGSYGNWVAHPLNAAMQRICRVCLFFVGVHSKSLAQFG